MIGVSWLHVFQALKPGRVLPISRLYLFLFLKKDDDHPGKGTKLPKLQNSDHKRSCSGLKS